MAKLREVIARLSKRQTLEARYSDHDLKGEWIGHRDCHVKDDWILIYRVDGNDLILVRTGKHSDLFGKNLGKRKPKLR